MSHSSHDQQGVVNRGYERTAKTHKSHAPPPPPRSSSKEVVLRDWAAHGQKCACCFADFPRYYVDHLPTCDCEICTMCFKQCFVTLITEKPIQQWKCPACDKPDFTDTKHVSEYLHVLERKLRKIMDPDIMEVFDTKQRDWLLMLDDNFRWCAHCEAGFIYAGLDIKMYCVKCGKPTCFHCKEKWEKEHEGVPCAEYRKQILDNKQKDAKKKKSLGELLERDIDCPRCKAHYGLARGGCMHFTCRQCRHEFCRDCSETYWNGGTCTRSTSCADMGLHCHHPRNCFNALVNKSIADIKSLLVSNRFKGEPLSPQATLKPCPVLVQKDSGFTSKDKMCGMGTAQGQAGLCVNHYKEYLVSVVNRNNIDPLSIFTVTELKQMLDKESIRYTDSTKQALMRVVKEKIPLRKLPAWS